MSKQDLSRQSDLICEALCKEMARAKRWHTIELAWQAMLKVRRMEKEMVAEQEYLAGRKSTVQALP